MTFQSFRGLLLGFARVGALALTAAPVALPLSINGATAATFSVVGGTSFNLNAAFNPSGWTNPDGIGVGTAVRIFDSTNTAGGNAGNVGLFGSVGGASLIFTYFGHEAAFTNVFEASSTYNSATPMFTNNVTAVGSSATKPYTAGLIPLLFASINYNPDAVAVNGGPINSSVALAFVVDPLNSNIAYAFFEDIYQGGDKDFDDMVVRIQACGGTTGISCPNNQGSTPIPAALPLFGSGLGALGLLGWRKRKRASVGV